MYHFDAMTKISAFLVHLGLSVIVAAVMVSTVFFVWYPAPLHKAVGVTDIFLMVVVIDVIIGPLLTLVVFKKDKRTLQFDLFVIAVLQMAALVYGVHTVYLGRPAFVVFAKDRFEIARPASLDPKSVKAATHAKNAVAEQSYLLSKWVAAIESPDPERRKEILFSAAAGGPDWPQLPELYVPLEQVRSEIVRRAKPLIELKPFNVGQEADVDVLTEQFGARAKWLPLKAPALDMVVLVNGANGEVLQVVDLRPW